LLQDEPYKKELKKDYETLWHLLGDMHASEHAAKEIVSIAAGASM
jgi:hypothetical protein